MPDYYDILKQIQKEWDDKFRIFVEDLKKKEVCLILFGSRGKGKANLLSDYDLLLISKDKITPITDFPSDLFCYTYEECLDEINKGNSIILDAFTQGRLIFDKLEVFDTLKRKVMDFIEKNNMKRNKNGWFTPS